MAEGNEVIDVGKKSWQEVELDQADVCTVGLRQISLLSA